jgi:hypothetical protein
MHMPANPAYAPDFAHRGWSVYVGISISVAVLAILLFYRRRFTEAAGRAAQTAVSSPPNPLT